MSYSNRMGNKGVWCPLKELYFPQIYAFTGRERDDDGTPLAWLYTLEPDSKVYGLASRLTASWMQASVMKAARVSARFS